MWGTLRKTYLTIVARKHVSLVKVFLPKTFTSFKKNTIARQSCNIVQLEFNKQLLCLKMFQMLLSKPHSERDTITALKQKSTLYKLYRWWQTGSVKTAVLQNL